MKKKMAMTVMALAVSAMAGSAFAANEPAKTTGSSAPLKMVNTDGTDALLKPIFSLEEMAKEKGISVEELIEQLEKEGKLTKATATSNPDGTIQGFAVISLDPENKDGGAFIALEPAMNLEEMAKEKGISVEELIEQLEKEGTIATGEAASFTQPAISLEQMAKEKGISVEELIKQLEKEGKITKGTTVSVSAIKK
ncbi:hypothetical protein QIH01_01510 [Brevibacillus brevis]|uniref:hypothetical protein n=1 Tax=Brevibacillus brevis TaxID=1393 RepID=UPI0007D8C588|nr:hypothetical protein [Brevibacillus brevis]WGV59838.1 hypothetical protein QIH01_01510 [Brevibacillus brevis]